MTLFRLSEGICWILCPILLQALSHLLISLVECFISLKVFEQFLLARMLDSSQGPLSQQLEGALKCLLAFHPERCPLPLCSVQSVSFGAEALGIELG